MCVTLTQQVILAPCLLCELCCWKSCRMGSDGPVLSAYTAARPAWRAACHGCSLQLVWG